MTDTVFSVRPFRSTRVIVSWRYPNAVNLSGKPLLFSFNVTTKRPWSNYSGHRKAWRPRARKFATASSCYTRQTLSSFFEIIMIGFYIAFACPDNVSVFNEPRFVFLLIVQPIRNRYFGIPDGTKNISSILWFFFHQQSLSSAFRCPYTRCFDFQRIRVKIFENHVFHLQCFQLFIDLYSSFCKRGEKKPSGTRRSKWPANKPNYFQNIYVLLLNFFLLK